MKRQKQIEHELATGNFLIPSTVTVAEFLMDWLPKQCSKHKWAPKTYTQSVAMVQNLIVPYIGKRKVQDLRTYDIEQFYATLSQTPCGQYVGGKRRDLSPKQQSSRVELGKKFESGFYAKPDTSSPQAVPAAGEPTISMTALLELLKDADPEMKAKLRLALLT